MPNETFERDPSQPEGPLISRQLANEIGSAMIAGAADSVKAASERREADDA